MNRFTRIFAAGCLLIGVCGCRKSTYERTIAHVDVGGKVLIYQENAPIRESFKAGNAAVKSLLQQKTGGMQQFIAAGVSDAADVLFEAINPDVVKALAYSVSGDGEKAPYRLRSFCFLGEKPEPSFFDVIPQKNRPFSRLAELPEETVFAIGGYDCPAAFWKNLCKAAENGKNSQFRLLLGIAESQIQQIFGVPAEEFLQGLEGEQQLCVIRDGARIQLKIAVSDGKGVLQKAFAAYADQEGIRKLEDGLYALDSSAVQTFGWGLRLRFRDGTMTLVTTPALLQAPAKPMADSGIWKPYWQDLPRRGTGYFLLRIPKDVTEDLAQACPEAAPLLRMIPELVMAGVMVRESDGIACTARSSLAISPFGSSLLPLAGAAAGILANLPDEPEKGEVRSAAPTAPAPPVAAVFSGASRAKTPAGNPPDAAGDVIQCQASMKRIMTSLLLYAAEHEDAFPAESGAAGLYELVERGYAEPALFRCRADRHPIASGRHHESSVSYYYLGGYTLEDGREQPNTPLLLEKPGIHAEHAVHVLFADGHWEKVDLDGPYTALSQALAACLAKHPLAPEAAAKLQGKIPQK